MQTVIIRLAALSAFALMLVFGTVGSAAAAERSTHRAHQVYAQTTTPPGTGIGGLGTKIDDFAAQVKAVARPAGGLSLTLIGLSFAFAPAFRQWAEDSAAR